MSFIELKAVCVDYPIFDAGSRSLKNHVLNIATGGNLNEDNRGRVIVRALDNVTFTIKSGERVGLLGHNGAGKSTLLRLLNGVYAPTSGSVSMRGEVGALIDISLGIDPEVTGRENIFLRGGLLGLKKSEIKQQIDDIIAFSELGDFIDMPLRTYSTGMRMRLAFAISTAVCPQILLMDEWLSVGDENFKHKAESRLSTLVQESNILVIASHSREHIENTCNRAIWLEHGRIVQDGPAEEVADAYFQSKQ